MKKPSKKATIGIVIAAVVVVIGIVAAVFGPMIYRDVIAEPAAEAPALEIESTTPSTGDASSLAGSWTVAAGSYAGYRVDEVLNGTDVTVTGRTETVSGTLTTTETELTAADITVDVASIATDEERRDEYFRSSALDTATNPEATFTLDEPVAALEGLAEGTQETIPATGTLTLNGVSQQVSIDITAGIDGDNVQVAGSSPVTFADYGVEAPNLGFVSVEPTGDVEFLLVLERA